MRKLTTLLLPFAVLWPTFSADLHAGGFGHGNFGRGFGGYGYNSFGRSYYGGFGYGAGSYGYGSSYSYGYSYPLAFQVVPCVQQQYVYVQPVQVQAYAATVPLPAINVQPLPAYAPAPVPVQADTAPSYPLSPPTPAVCAGEIRQGYLTADTVAYLATLTAFERYRFLHVTYGATFRDRFFTRHFGTIPAGFRGRIGPAFLPRSGVERIGPRGGRGGDRPDRK